MVLGSWAKRTFSKERFSFALGLASLFLVLGLLFYWVHMALQSPLTRIRASRELLAFRFSPEESVNCFLSGTSPDSHGTSSKHSLRGRIACTHGKYSLYSWFVNLKHGIPA